MPLNAGDPAPDFSLPSTSGEEFTLSKDAGGKPIVLYFYPKDFTSVCTEEACEFRDAFDVFAGLEADVVGISRDSVSTHHKFRAAHELPFHLLADVDGQVAKLYKAAVPVINFTRRVTYLLDKSHRIAAVYENTFSAQKHIHETLKSLKGLGEKA